MENKQNFLDGLRRALTGRISSGEVEAHIRYYDEYITAEIRKGRSEEDVMNSLGKPGLIAMSICDANKAAGERLEGHNCNSEGTKAYEESYGQENAGQKDGRPFLFRHPKLAVALIIVIVLLILGIGIWLAVSLVSFFWPVIVTVVAVVLLIRLLGFIKQNW